MIVRESIDFERGQDPKRALAIGKYEGFRNRYNKKPFLEISIDLYKNDISKPGPEEATYKVYLFYERDWEETGDPDSVYFFNEKLFDNSGVAPREIPMKIMDNEPIYFFEYGNEERTMWKEEQEELFNTNIIDLFLKEKYQALVNNLSEEWFESPDFMNMLSEWISSGNYRTDSAEINPL